MVRRNSVGKYRRNSDDFAVNRNVVGNSSEYTDELPTTTTVTFFIGMSSKSRRKIPTNHISSEFRRKWPTEFRRPNFFGFGRKFVSIPSQMSDDLGVCRNLRRNSVCFLVVCYFRTLYSCQWLGCFHVEFMDELLYVASELRARGILNWQERLLLRFPCLARFLDLHSALIILFPCNEWSLELHDILIALCLQDKRLRTYPYLDQAYVVLRSSDRQISKVSSQLGGLTARQFASSPSILSLHPGQLQLAFPDQPARDPTEISSRDFNFSSFQLASVRGSLGGPVPTICKQKD
ncbi:hypothetical protein F2Q68_00014904 [Brassica cretica]|uniref:Uncharacterized protein n=1 Tax=Brassica cretica TaxID=69181 RepID=A0A8S9HE46_BRACR|nr:hypothetical protein F2Q68_00014904 [Brassica cretica]